MKESGDKPWEVARSGADAGADRGWGEWDRQPAI
jgi:hypothetical protein